MANTPTQRLTSAATAFASTWAGLLPPEAQPVFFEQLASLLQTTVSETMEWTTRLSAEAFRDLLQAALVPLVHEEEPSDG